MVGLTCGGGSVAAGGCGARVGADGTTDVPPGLMTTVHRPMDGGPGDGALGGASETLGAPGGGTVSVGQVGGGGRVHGDAVGSGAGRDADDGTGGSGGAVVAAGVQLTGVGAGGTDVAGPPPPGPVG